MIGDKKARMSCLIMAVVTGALGYAAYALSAPSPVTWALAIISVIYAFAGIFGPKGLRWMLLLGNMGEGS